MISLDTSVVIALLSPQARQAAVELFERLLRGGVELQEAAMALGLKPALT